MPKAKPHPEHSFSAPSHASWTAYKHGPTRWNGERGAQEECVVSTDWRVVRLSVSPLPFGDVLQNKQKHAPCVCWWVFCFNESVFFQFLWLNNGLLHAVDLAVPLKQWYYHLEWIWAVSVSALVTVPGQFTMLTVCWQRKNQSIPWGTTAHFKGLVAVLGDRILTVHWVLRNYLNVVSTWMEWFIQVLKANQSFTQQDRSNNMCCQSKQIYHVSRIQQCFLGSEMCW